MACTKCKKKTTISGETEIEVNQVEPVLEILKYKLRDSISYNQIGLIDPSDEQIEAFLMANPNRKSLFKELPDNMRLGLSKG